MFTNFFQQGTWLILGFAALVSSNDLTRHQGRPAYGFLKNYVPESITVHFHPQKCKIELCHYIQKKNWETLAHQSITKHF